MIVISEKQKNSNILNQIVIRGASKIKRKGRKKSATTGWIYNDQNSGRFKSLRGAWEMEDIVSEASRNDEGKLGRILECMLDGIAVGLTYEDAEK